MAQTAIGMQISTHVKKMEKIFNSAPQKPNEINWLTDDLIKTLDQHVPSKEEGFSANEQVDEGEMVVAFAADFIEDSRWTNMHQLHQAVNYLGNVYGFPQDTQNGRSFVLVVRLTNRGKRSW